MPLPVGPVTSSMPYGSAASLRIAARAPSSNPRLSRVSPFTSSASACLSRIRSTASSPKLDGMIETRMSISRPRALTLKRPSCGTRRSAMSSSATTLMREIICSARSSPANVATVFSTPSIRYLIARPAGPVSRWMSEAPLFSAS